MDNTFDYHKARTYASRYGAIVGLCWILSFLSYMGGLTTPFLADIGLILGIASVFVAGNIIRYYHNACQSLTFGKAWWMAITLYLCATLLTAIAGSFFGGFISARILGRMGLLAGLSSAVLFLAVMLAVSFCFPQETISWAAAAGKVGAILLSGTLGGIAATGKRQKIRKRL